MITLTYNRWIETNVPALFMHICMNGSIKYFLLDGRLSSVDLLGQPPPLANPCSHKLLASLDAVVEPKELAPPISSSPWRWSCWTSPVRCLKTCSCRSVPKPKLSHRNSNGQSHINSYSRITDLLSTGFNCIQWHMWLFACSNQEWSYKGLSKSAGQSCKYISENSFSNDV